MQDFLGYHSEWNLGSPGGWDYQRITQIIGKSIWERLNRIRPIPVALDFDHPLLLPVNGFVEMLADAYRERSDEPGSIIAIVAEEETLESVTENKNLADHLNAIDGISSALMAPQELDLHRGRVCWKGRPVSVIFMDFNTDVLLALHRKHNLEPVLQAVREHRVINPRGTEPINVKSMFEVVTGPDKERFHEEIVRRTPWTRQFYPRRTHGPDGMVIDDLIEWTREHWDDLVLKPERGYSGKGVMNGGATATRLGLPGISPIAEELMLERDLTLVREPGARYHVCHVSTRRAVELVRQAKAAGLPVTAEVCPHHLLLTEEACADYNTYFKVNPPLRTRDDVKACLQGVVDGTLDCLVTDHAPHGIQQKELEFLDAPFGIIGLENALPLYVKALIKPGLLDWPALIERMTVRPARVLSLNKGTLSVGADGDVTVIDPDAQWAIDAGQFRSKSRNCPFDGSPVTGRAVATLAGGKIKYQLEPQNA